MKQSLMLSNTCGSSDTNRVTLTSTAPVETDLLGTSKSNIGGTLVERVQSHQIAEKKWRVDSV